MKLAIIFSSLLFFGTSIGMGISGQVAKNFRSSLQENAPDFYINHWRDGNVVEEDLHEAIQEGRNDFVATALIRVKRRGDSITENVSRLLSTAIAVGNGRAAKLLLDKGASVNRVDSNGQSPLHRALAHQNTFIAGLILAKRPTLNSVDTAGDSILSILKKSSYSQAEVEQFARYLAHNHRAQMQAAIPLLIQNSEDTFLAACAQKDPKIAQEIGAALIKRDDDALLTTLANVSPEIGKGFADHCKKLVPQYAELAANYQKLCAFKQQAIKYQDKELNLCGLMYSFRPQIAAAYGAAVTLDQHMAKGFPANDNSIAFFNYAVQLYGAGAQWRSLEQLSAINKILGAVELQEFSCCICAESYETKPYVTVCKNNHTVCFSCYNAPQLTGCPLCRAELPVDRLRNCQSCRASTEAVKLFNCTPCNTMTVLCSKCVQLPCCKQSLSLDAGPSLIHSLNGDEFAKKYIRSLAEKSHSEYDAVEKSTLIAIAEIEKKARQVLDSLDMQIKAHKATLAIKSPELAKLKQLYEAAAANPFLSKHYADEHDQLLDELRQTEAKHNRLAAAFNAKLKKTREDIEALQNALEEKKTALDKKLDATAGQLQRMVWR